MHSWHTIGKPFDEHGCTMLAQYCFYIWWRSYSILNNFFIENQFNQNQKLIGEFGLALGIVKKPLANRI
jgi:hypothetical protein